MREKVLKNYQDKAKILYLDEYSWDNLKSKGEKIQYLNKLGLPLLLKS
jgi:hypothetical protein